MSILISAALCSATLLMQSEAGLKTEVVQSREDKPVYQMVSLPEKLQDAKQSVFPAVVFIRVIQETTEVGRNSKINAAGSGVLISEGGEVLTNWHVVNKAQNIRCQLTDGSVFDAELIGADKDLDIALLKLKTDRKNFTFAKLEPTLNATEGDFVLAMGAPWGMSRSVSLGIVACAKRYLPESEYTLWIQTDASISPGNSGGPMVNAKGNVIGINTLGGLFGGDIGFAVPSSTILTVLPDLRQYKQIRWGWLGISLQAINDFSKNMYFERGSGGVIVSHVEPKSPGKLAGLIPQDRILAINGVKTDAFSEDQLPDINRSMQLLPLGKEAEFKVLRNGAEMVLKVIPVERGPSESDFKKYERFGFTLKEINRFESPVLFYLRDKGVYIEAFGENSNAQKSGNFSRHDIIVDINSEPVNSLADMTRIYDEAVKAIPRKTKLTFRIQRGTETMLKVLDYADGGDEEFDEDISE